jgi:hypothetical protein
MSPMSPRRPVDPSLSPEANRILGDELRAIEGPGADGRQAPVAPTHAVHTPGVANLISARLGAVITLAAAVVVGAIIALVSGATWVLLVALAVLCLGTAVVVGAVYQLSDEVEHLAPEDAALLEEEGVGDPDRLLEELVEEAEAPAQPGPPTTSAPRTPIRERVGLRALTAMAAPAALAAAILVATMSNDRALDWVLAAALAVLGLALAAAAAFRRHDHPVVLALAATAALVAAGTGIASAAHHDDTRAQTPTAAVRDFLVAALVDNNGNAATNYLTPRARQEIAAREPAGSRASAAQLLSNLTLDGPRDTAITTEHAIDALSLRVTKDDDNHVRVTLQTAGGPRTLTVVNAFPHGDDADFNPPDTPWRIDAGIGALASGAAAGGT